MRIPSMKWAKISGNLKSAIEKVIQDNPDLEGLALKKLLKLIR
jgi:hypothetical protein